MPLNALLSITDALLHGSGAGLAEGHVAGATEATEATLLPFAAVLSGTLSLLTPDQATPQGDTAEHPLSGEAEASESKAAEAGVPDTLVQRPGLVAPDPSGMIKSATEPASSSTLASAVDQGHQGPRPDSMTTPAAEIQAPMLEDGALQAKATVPARAATPDPALRHDAAQQAATGGSSPSASATKQAPGQAAEPSSGIARRVLQADAQAAEPSSGIARRVLQADAQAAEPSSGIARRVLQADAQAADTVLDPSKEDGAEGAAAMDKAFRRRPSARAGTHRDANRITVPVAHAAEQAAPPVGAESKESPAQAMARAEAASAVPEGDAVLPDLEAATPEKTTETSRASGEKATAIDIDSGGVSADAGGDSDTKKDGTRRTRRSRGTEAEPSARSKTEQSAVEQARLQDTTAASQPGAPDETTPELAVTENAALPDLDPTLAPAEEQVAPTASDKTTADAPAGRARAARGLFQQNRAVPVAWLRAVLNNARQTVFSEDGWKVLEMNLDEGDGTVTIKARREEGRVAVAVGFSDPELRALASTHAERLQEALQAQYEATVDFSLFSGNPGDPGAQGQHEASGTAGVEAAHAEDGTSEDHPARRALPTGTLHEWVG